MNPTLPIDAILPEILSALEQSPQVILTATPGAGKTTRLPPHLLGAVKGKIAVLEPRRMAAVSACQRVAEEQNWVVGKDVGYQVRFESKVQKDTRLVFMTDALLLRKLIESPELSDFGLIIIDEFHERGLNQDIILGIIKELQDMGSSLKLLIMSATLDVSRLQEFLPQSLHIDVPGKVFPLEIRHQSSPQKLQTDADFYQRLNDAVLGACRETQGDILVFLPGQGEISRLEKILQDSVQNRQIFQLHGSLSLQNQKDILKPHNVPRIILATNIAEASVTVPGVDFVIDSGLMKSMDVHLQSGFSRLQLHRIAQFNAKQRSGRAARQKSGVSLRLWTPHEESTMPQQIAPECQRMDLSSTLLLLSHLGVHDFKNFSWFDKPPQVLIERAEESLKNLAAIDSSGRLTPQGHKLLRFPLPPRWSSLLVLSEHTGGSKPAALTVALLQEKDIVLKSSEASSYDECDITYRLHLLEDSQTKRHDISLRNRDNVLEVAKQLQELMPASQKDSSDPLIIKKLLLRTQMDRLCRRRKGSDRGIMVGGRGVRLAKESQVKTSEFFIGLAGIDFPGQPDTTLSLACGVSKALVLEVLSDFITVHEEIFFDEPKGEFFNRRVRRLYDLDIDEPTLSRIDSRELGEKFVEVALARWSWITEQHKGLNQFMKRWHFWVQQIPEMNQHLTQEHIHKTIQMAAYGKTLMTQVLEQDLVGYLESTMDKSIVRQFHKEVPERFQAPSGFSHAIHYLDSETPFVEVRLQEVFGLTKTPRLALGRIPLTFKLLGPNYRPVQVTSDIEGFWQRAYVEVRKELRGRYPKHSWPEDPLTALPVAKGSRKR